MTAQPETVPADRLLDLITTGVTRSAGHDALHAIRHTSDWEPLDATPAPPTYPTENGPKGSSQLWMTQRDGRRAVVVDSIGSQANRCEAAMLDLRDSGKARWPTVSLDTGSGVVDLCELSHRHCDAMLHAAHHGGEPWLESGPGKALAEASQDDISALARWAPGSIIWGFWDSSARLSKRRERRARLWQSEMVGVADGRDVAPIPARALKVGGLIVGGTLTAADIADFGLKAGKTKVTEAGLGSVPSIGGENGPWRGADFDTVRRTSVLSLPSLRRALYNGTDQPQAKALLAVYASSRGTRSVRVRLCRTSRPLPTCCPP